MNHKMRRSKQQLSDAESISVLDRNQSGVLSLIGTDGYPYGVPVSYVLIGNSIYFHGAREGYKLECIRNCKKACFTVIDLDRLIPEEYTTYFRSVIAFGTISEVKDEREMRNSIEVFAGKFMPEDEEGRLKEIDREWPDLLMLRLDIEELTGKQAIELVGNT